MRHLYNFLVFLNITLGCIGRLHGAPINHDDTFFYNENQTRFRLVKSVPGENIPDWLFLPGGPGVDSNCFLSLVDKMDAPGNYWLIDLVWNGTNDQSSKPPSETFEKWNIFLVDSVKYFENPVLVGHSFGGFLPFFCPELEGLLKGLVILNSVPTLSSEIFAQVANEHQMPSLSEAQERFVKEQSLESLQALYLLESVYFFDSKHRSLGIEQVVNKLEFSIPAEYWWYTQGVQFYMKEITWVPQNTPTLIVGGSRDYITPLSIFTSDMRFKRENIEMQLIENAGHFPWIEESQKLNELLKLLLQRASLGLHPE